MRPASNGVADALEAHDLSKSFAGVRAVEDVSLSVRKGEIYGFLGPNGAGKTTTLRVLLGLAKPDTGHTRIRGVDPREDPVRARHGVGYLPEQLAFYRTLTGRQTLRFFADLRGAPRERCDELLALVELEGDADRRVSEYSRGMTQRLGIAQAFLGDPDVLVLDEPLTGLDPHAQRQVKDMLAARARDGATILFSSHQLNEVQELADRVGVLRRGRLVAEDSMNELRSRLGLQGAIVLTLDRPSRSILQAVRDLPEVSHARLNGARLTIACEPSRRFDVARRVHDAGGGIIGLETREPSLEEVFLHLTEPPEDEGEGGAP